MTDAQLDLKALADAIKAQLGMDMRETIHLTKNTKGYNWEIKTFFSATDTETIQRLQNIDAELRDKFGSVLE